LTAPPFGTGCWPAPGAGYPGSLVQLVPPDQRERLCAAINSM